MYPHMVKEIQQITQNHTEQIRQIMNLKYSEILDRLLSNLENVISDNMTIILRNQLDFLKILPPILPQDSTYQLPPDQYYIISTLKCYLDKRNTTVALLLYYWICWNRKILYDSPFSKFFKEQ